ncbi:7TMR-DISM family protein [Algoriphagus hitonicola]
MKLVILYLLVFLKGFSPIQLTEEPQDLNSYSYLILDKDETLSIEGVLVSNDFIDLENEVKNFGINNDVVWLKYSVLNNSSSETKFFYINNPSLDSLQLYVASEGEVLKQYSGGRLEDYNSKPIPSKSIIFKIDLPQGQVSDLYLRVKSVNKKIITSTISNRDFVEGLINNENIFFGIFTGVILGLFFYNLFLYFSVKDKLYLIYVIHTVLVWFAQSSILGFTQELIWQDSVWLNLRSGVIFSSLVSMVGIWFLRVFLSTKSFIPKIDSGFYYIYGVYFFILINAFFFSITVSYQTLLVTQSIVVLYVLFAAFSVLKLGYRPARYYLVAWSIFMLGIFLFVLSEMGLIP